jgi:hypothetical protein
MTENERVRHLIDTLPSVNTANFEVLSDAILDRLASFAEICAFYDDGQRYRILKLKDYKWPTTGTGRNRAQADFWILQIWTAAKVVA